MHTQLTLNIVFVNYGVLNCGYVHAVI